MNGFWFLQGIAFLLFSVLTRTKLKVSVASLLKISTAIGFTQRLWGDDLWHCKDNAFLSTIWFWLNVIFSDNECWFFSCEEGLCFSSSAVRCRRHIKFVFWIGPNHLKAQIISRGSCTGLWLRDYIRLDLWSVLPILCYPLDYGHVRGGGGHVEWRNQVKGSLKCMWRLNV